MSDAGLFRQATEQLKAAGIDNPRLEARLLIDAAFHPPLEGGSKNPPGFFGEGLAARSSNDPAPKFAAQISTLPQGEGGLPSELQTLLARRCAREPLAYILGRKEFWSLDFEIGPGALVPRPETETLIEAALEAFPDRAAPLAILDLGSGSGCLIVTALSLYPNATGTAVDISAEALAWTARNARKHGVAGRLALIEGGFEAAAGGFDLILTNPPYLTEAELAAADAELGYEPAGALKAGADGLGAYRVLAQVIPGLLAPGGQAFIELGAGQDDSVSALFRETGLSVPAVRPDLAGVPRVLRAELSRT